MKTAFIFPGQGSQYVGMGKDLLDFPICADIFNQIDYCLGFELSKIIFEGPESLLTKTEYTQPAMMAVSFALVKLLENKSGKMLNNFADLIAGHSLGEFTALTAAGAFSHTDSAKLLNLRGKVMQESLPENTGGMVALLGADLAVAKELAKNCMLEVANDNSPTQQVLSGYIEKIDEVIKLAAEKKIRAIKLNVSAPFHSSLMANARDVLKRELNKVKINPPLCPVVQNFSLDVTSSCEIISKNLIEQVTGTVRWRETIDLMVSLGVKTFVEIGPGKVLTNMIKRSYPDLKIFNISTAQDVDEFLSQK